MSYIQCYGCGDVIIRVLGSLTAFHFVLFFICFLFSLFIIINNNIIISYSGGQLDGPVAFLAACPYIIFICYFMHKYYWEIKMLACFLAIKRLRVWVLVVSLSHSDSRQGVHAHVSLLPSSKIWYWPNDGDARKVTMAWQTKMAA